MYANEAGGGVVIKKNCKFFPLMKKMFFFSDPITKKHTLICVYCLKEFLSHSIPVEVEDGFSYSLPVRTPRNVEIDK